MSQSAKHHGSFQTSVPELLLAISFKLSARRAESCVVQWFSISRFHRILPRRTGFDSRHANAFLDVGLSFFVRALLPENQRLSSSEAAWEDPASFPGRFVKRKDRICRWKRLTPTVAKDCSFGTLKTMFYFPASLPSISRVLLVDVRIRGPPRASSKWC